MDLFVLYSHRFAAKTTCTILVLVLSEPGKKDAGQGQKKCCTTATWRLMRPPITRRCVLDNDYAGTYLRRVVLNQPQQENPQVQTRTRFQ